MPEGRFKSITIREDAYEAAGKLVKEGRAKSVCDVVSTATLSHALNQREERKTMQELKELREFVQEIRELRDAIKKGDLVRKD